MVIIKGHEIETVIFKNAHNRRAVQMKNNIVMLLRNIGINENGQSILQVREKHFKPLQEQIPVKGQPLQ